LIRYLFKKINQLFITQSKFNIGQIGLLCEIFRENRKLANEISIENLNYFITLIVKHGHYEEFLRIFEILLNPSFAQHDLEIYYKIIRVLIPLKRFEFINVLMGGKKIIGVFCLFLFSRLMKKSKL